MATQEGILPVKGTMGKITFFKSKDGYMAKTKSEVSAEKIATAKEFERTRENMEEFGRAGSGAKLIRKSLSSSIAKTKDNRMSSRLTATMMKVLKGDTKSDRGKRNIAGGEIGFVQGFEFNNNARLTSTLSATISVTFDRTTGDIEVSVADFIPLNMMTAPEGATHFQLFAAAAAIDFETGIFETGAASADPQPYSGSSTGDITMTFSLSKNSPNAVLIIVGIEFSQQVNGKYYSLKNGAFNSCAVVKVDTQQ